MRIHIGFIGVDPIAPTLELVKLAEKAGIDGVVSSEHLGFHDAIVPSALFLHNTSKMEVNIVGLGPASRHPGVLAMELASLAEIANNRLRIQVGTGAVNLVDKIGGFPARPIPLVRSFVDVLRTLLSGGVVTDNVPAAPFDDFGLMVADENGLRALDARSVPIDIMAVKPAMLRLAAEIGEGVALSGGGSLQYLTETIGYLIDQRSNLDVVSDEFRTSAIAYSVIDPDAEKHAWIIQQILGGYDPATLTVLMRGVFDADGYTRAAAIDRQKAIKEYITFEAMRKVAVIASGSNDLYEVLRNYKQTSIDSLTLHLVGPMETRAYAIECIGESKSRLDLQT